MRSEDLREHRPARHAPLQLLQQSTMDVQHLKVFSEVVQQGSFAGAARQLDLTPSAVTRAVAVLEATLGARLLQRTTRKVALTEAGAAYLERVRPLLEDLERAGEELHAHTGQVRGTVRVTASVAYGQMALVPLLPRCMLRTRHWKSTCC